MPKHTLKWGSSVQVLTSSPMKISNKYKFEAATQTSSQTSTAIWVKQVYFDILRTSTVHSNKYSKVEYKYSTQKTQTST